MTAQGYQRFIFLLTAALFLWVVSIIPLLGPRAAYALSIKEEQELGEEFLNKIKMRYSLLEDDFAEGYLTDLGDYLASSIRSRPFNFRYYIIKDDTLNAFAAPGGHIFFYSGLLELFETIDELSAVLTHEMGHVMARHLSQRIEQNKMIGFATLAGVLAGALIGGEAAEALTAGSLAAGIQAQLHYSRRDERQADQLGFEYMVDAGFDPHGMIYTLKKLERGNWFQGAQLPGYLLTHPSGPERMANLDSLMSGYEKEAAAKEAIERFTALFPLFKVIIRARCKEPAEAERLFRMDLEKESDSALAHLGLGIALKEQANYEKALFHLKKARRLEPRFHAVLPYLGETFLLMGEGENAIEVLEQARQNYAGGGRAGRFLLAQAYEKQGNHEKAIAILEGLASAAEPVKNEVFYHLGLSYGRSNRLAQAHFNFGRHFARLRKAEKALFHFKKAQELAEGMPVLQDKIRKEEKRLSDRGSDSGIKGP